MPTKSGREYQGEALSPMQRLGRAVRAHIDAAKTTDTITNKPDNTNDNDQEPTQEAKETSTINQEESSKQQDHTGGGTGLNQDIHHKYNPMDLMQQALNHRKRTPLLNDFKRYNKNEDYQHRNALEFRTLDEFAVLQPRAIATGLCPSEGPPRPFGAKGWTKGWISRGLINGP
jgi:superfamily II DNA or RNA helicase